MTAPTARTLGSAVREEGTLITCRACRLLLVGTHFIIHRNIMHPKEAGPLKHYALSLFSIETIIQNCLSFLAPLLPHGASFNVSVCDPL